VDDGIGLKKHSKTSEDDDFTQVATNFQPYVYCRCDVMFFIAD
jgi:hypothetical protein